MDAIATYLRKRRGRARMKDMKAGGFQTRDIRKLVEKGHIVKVKPGLYRLSNLPPEEEDGIVQICLAMPKAVICLASAFHFTNSQPSSRLRFPMRFQPPISRPSSPGRQTKSSTSPRISTNPASNTAKARRTTFGFTVQRRLSATFFDSVTGLAKTFPLKA